jgi:hypothetical protein
MVADQELARPQHTQTEVSFWGDENPKVAQNVMREKNTLNLEFPSYSATLSSIRYKVP